MVQNFEQKVNGDEQAILSTTNSTQARQKVYKLKLPTIWRMPRPPRRGSRAVCR